MVFEKLEASLKKIVEFLSLKIHFLLYQSDVFFILLLMASDLTGSNNCDLSF